MTNAFFREAARIWLENQGAALHRRGAVMFWEGRAVAWCETPKPSDWQPGAVAVTLGGDFPVMVATGGNDCDGADRWEVRR